MKFILWKTVLVTSLLQMTDKRLKEPIENN